MELVGEGTFGSVYKAKKEVYGNISYAAIKVIEIPKEPREIRDLQQSDMDEEFYQGILRRHDSQSDVGNSDYGINEIREWNCRN